MVRFLCVNDTATTEIYTLSLHDALPISPLPRPHRPGDRAEQGHRVEPGRRAGATAADQCRRRRPSRVRGAAGTNAPDRKSTRLNSSHANISYAVFCLKKQKIITLNSITT